MRIFVTGGTGFIGKHLVRALVKNGHQVQVLVRKKEDLTGVQKLGAKGVLGDLEDKRFLREALSGYGLCYHLAAIRSDWGYSWQDYYHTNVELTRNLLEAAAGQIKQFILISSVKADHPITPYGKSKQEVEKLALNSFRKKNLPITIIRPAIVYGPGDSFLGMMPKLIRLIKNARFITVGSGKNRLHLLYVDDLIQALILAGKSLGTGEIYTIASEKPITLNALTSLVAQKLKVKILPVKIPVFLANFAGIVFERLYPLVSLNEPPITKSKVQTITYDKIYDISKAQKELGFAPYINYEEGIELTIDDYLKRWK